MAVVSGVVTAIDFGLPTNDLAAKQGADEWLFRARISDLDTAESTYVSVPLLTRDGFELGKVSTSALALAYGIPGEDMVVPPSENRAWTVTWASVLAAAITTLRDAFGAKWKVEVEYVDQPSIDPNGDDLHVPVRVSAMRALPDLQLADQPQGTQQAPQTGIGTP